MRTTSQFICGTQPWQLLTVLVSSAIPHECRDKKPSSPPIRLKRG